MEAFIFLFEKCRLCLEQTGVIHIIECESKDLPEDIYLCTGIKIHPSDNFPKKICNQCFSIVQNAKKLRVRALKNNMHLRSLFVIDGVDKINSVTVPIEMEKVTIKSETNEQIKNELLENEMVTEPIVMEKVTIKSETNEQIKNELLENEMTPSKNIKVRKDLFTTSPSESPSKRIKTEEEDQVDDVHSCKRIRLDDDTVLFECCICFKTFDRWKKLYLHHRLHKKTEVCPLETCGKKFSTKGDLEKHIRIHTGEKPYKCNQCDRSFSQRVTLKVHRERVHCVLLV